MESMNRISLFLFFASFLILDGCFEGPSQIADVPNQPPQVHMPIPIETDLATSQEGQSKTAMAIGIGLPVAVIGSVTIALLFRHFRNNIQGHTSVLTLPVENTTTFQDTVDTPPLIIQNQPVNPSNTTAALIPNLPPKPTILRDNAYVQILEQPDGSIQAVIKRAIHQPVFINGMEEVYESQLESVPQKIYNQTWVLIPKTDSSFFLKPFLSNQFPEFADGLIQPRPSIWGRALQLKWQNQDATLWLAGGIQLPIPHNNSSNYVLVADSLQYISDIEDIKLYSWKSKNSLSCVILKPIEMPAVNPSFAFEVLYFTGAVVPFYGYIQLNGENAAILDAGKTLHTAIQQREPLSEQQLSTACRGMERLLSVANRFHLTQHFLSATPKNFLLLQRDNRLAALDMTMHKLPDSSFYRLFSVPEQIYLSLLSAHLKQFLDVFFVEQHVELSDLEKPEYMTYLNLIVKEIVQTQFKDKDPAHFSSLEDLFKLSPVELKQWFDSVDPALGVDDGAGSFHTKLSFPQLIREDQVNAAEYFNAGIGLARDDLIREYRKKYDPKKQETYIPYYHYKIAFDFMQSKYKKDVFSSFNTYQSYVGNKQFLLDFYHPIVKLRMLHAMQKQYGHKEAVLRIIDKMFQEAFPNPNLDLPKCLLELKSM